jgi:hypothetical protein
MGCMDLHTLNIAKVVAASVDLPKWGEEGYVANADHLPFRDRVLYSICYFASPRQSTGDPDRREPPMVFN